MHNQQEALHLQGLSEDNHRHWSWHGVGHTGPIDVARTGQDPLGLALYKLAELPCRCCSLVSGICWCSLSKPFTTKANHLPHSPPKQLLLGCGACEQLGYLNGETAGLHPQVDIQSPFPGEDFAVPCTLFARPEEADGVGLEQETERN